MYYTDKQIDADSGTVFVNNTRKYLAPMLYLFGEEFIEHLKTNHVISMSIQDYGVNIKNETRQLDGDIYILFDVNGTKKFGHYVDLASSRFRFNETLTYFQSLPAFLYDYPYDSTKDGNRHVCVFRLPHLDKFKLFTEGRYSEMYTKEELSKLVRQYEGRESKKKQVVTDVWAVLTKDEGYFPKFQERVFEEFGVQISDDGREYDYPVSLRKEILRYDTPLHTI